MERRTADRLTETYRPSVWSRRELMTAGRFTRRTLDAAVQSGELIRIRRDHYARADISPAIAEAVRIGGRLSCLSLLARIGVFVQTCSALHVQLPRASSRIRRPRVPDTVLHWVSDADTYSPRHMASLADAARQAIRCQPPRAALATLDSLLNLGVLDREQVIALFDGLPRQYRALIPLIDGSAGSGPETYTRLILRAVGAAYETQVQIDEVGRVDFVVDGWLIIECDSEAHHAGWDQQREDRRRDTAAARQGYVTIRLLANDIMHRPEWVRMVIEEVLAQRAGGFGRAARRSAATA